MYNFDESKVIEEIKARKASKVLLQFPEGLKKEALRFSNLLNDNKIEVIVSGDHCWGACDLALDDAKKFNVDLLVNFGHVEFNKVDFPVLYVPIKYECNIKEFFDELQFKLGSFKKIGLISSIQHVHQLEEVKHFLELFIEEAIIPDKRGFSQVNGHILGCEYNSVKAINDKVDAFLVLGNRFHALGASLSTEKPVLLLDVANKEFTFMDEIREKIVKQRAIAINKVSDAKKIGLITSTKSGQNFGSFKSVKADLEKMEKEVIVLTMDEITNDKLVNFYDVEAFIEFACPRVAVEDYSRFEKPLVNYREALVVTGKLEWEEFLKQGLL
nr:diphthamide biosynthesis enzyme Dph2 [Candidatus Woesearchaeota archaeon]